MSCRGFGNWILKMFFCFALLFFGCAVQCAFAEDKVVLSSGQAQQRDGKAAADKILKVYFVGASHTRGHLLPKIVAELAESAPAGQQQIIVDWSELPGGMAAQWEAGLVSRLNSDKRINPTPRNRIEAEPWDIIVFDAWGGIGVKDEVLNDYVKWIPKWTDYIRSKNAKPILYGTPPALVDPYPGSFRKWHDFIVEQGKKAKITVASSANAWLKYLGQDPTFEQRKALYASDGVHMQQKGTYIMACSVYCAVTGSSPVGLTNKTSTCSISKEDAAAIQEASWKAYQETILELKP